MARYFGAGICEWLITFRGVLPVVPLATTVTEDEELDEERLTDPDAEGSRSLDDFPRVRTLGAFLAVLWATFTLTLEDEAVGVVVE